VMLIGLYLLILGPEFLGAWMASPVYHDRSGPVLQLLMLSFFFYLPVRGVALPILMGLGKPKAPALGLLAAGALNLGISLALVKPLSILGVALGTAIPNILFSWYILRLACRELGVPMSRYLQYVAGRTLIGALAPAAVLVFIKLFLQPASMPAVLVAGVVMTLVFALTWVLYVYRDDSYLDLRGELSRLGGRA
jgi:O-antigen/teichoic acid export membrane protein